MAQFNLNMLSQKDQDLVKRILQASTEMMALADLANDRGIPVVFAAKSVGGVEFWMASLEVHLDPKNVTPKKLRTTPLFG